VDDQVAPQGVAPRRRALRIVAGLLVTGGLAALIAVAVPFRETAAALGKLDASWLVPMLAAYAFTFVCRAVRFRALGIRLPLPVLLGVSSIHQFMNRVLPLRTGELAFPVLVRRLCDTSLVEGFTLVVLVRLLDLASVVLAFFLALLGVPAARAAIGPVGTALVAAALPALVAGYLLLPSVGVRVARRLAARFALRRPGWAQRLEQAAGTLELVRGASRRAFLAAAGWTVLLWTATFVAFWAAITAVGIELGPAELVVGSTAAIVASVLPIGGIGSFGTLEGGWAAGFVLVGVAGGPAVASALVVSGTSFAFAGVVAGIAWVALSRRRSRAPGAR
jgi:uncharacterized membrane protein YbhN (UPF0104 family)